MTVLRILTGILLLALMGILHLSALPPQPEKLDLIQRGQASYRLYCQSCHGESGKGDGPMARLLKVPPADLTLISARNGGRFPERRVYNTIEGRQEVRGHGQREMPVWGDAFDSRSDPKQVEVKIGEIIEYLKSIQVEQHAKAEEAPQRRR